VVAKVREGLAVKKQKFQKETINLKKLNKVDGKEKYDVEVSNRFAALGYLIYIWSIVLPYYQLLLSVHLLLQSDCRLL
jgi:hypothetical protein